MMPGLSTARTRLLNGLMNIFCLASIVEGTYLLARLTLGGCRHGKSVIKELYITRVNSVLWEVQ